MVRQFHADIIVFGFTALVVLAVGLTLRNPYYLQVASIVGIFSIAAVGLNLVLGAAGQISLGQAAFMGIGAYTSAMLLKIAHFSFLTGLVMGGLITIPFGLLVGYSALRLKGNYLAMATLAFGGIIFGLLMKLDFIGGPRGLLGVPPIEFFGWKASSPGDKYWVVWGLALLVYLMALSMLRSRFGRALSAIREDEVAASTLGINVAWYKVQVFVISSVIAGVAGALFASYQGALVPYRFDIMPSVLLLCMVVVGGLGNIHGTILGAAVITILPEFGRAWEQYRLAGYGLFLVLLMIFMPRGLTYLLALIKEKVLEFFASNHSRR